jgi:hypothetical protein
MRDFQLISKMCEAAPSRLLSLSATCLHPQPLVQCEKNALLRPGPEHSSAEQMTCTALTVKEKPGEEFMGAGRANSRVASSSC